MDLRAILGLVLVAVALVLAVLALAADATVLARFLSLPKRKGERLGLLLAALAAFVIGVQLVTRLGYSLPLLQALHPDALSLYPAVALGLLSLGAMFIERRVGILYGAISLSLIVFLVFGGPV